MSAVAEQVAPVSIIDAFTDDNLLGNSFADESREAMKAVLSGAFAVPMQHKRKQLFKKLAGGRQPPRQRVSELAIVGGRRISKTESGAGTAIYIGTILIEQDGTLDRLAPGETPTILIVACDRTQAKVAINYVKGILHASPILSQMVANEGAEFVELVNGVYIEVATNSHRNIRGRTQVATIFDEVAFFRDETSANPDTELYRAVTPSLATTNGMLIMISSPYAKRGLLYDRWRKHYGQNSDDVLVVQGSTLDFNPTIPKHIIEDAYAADPEAAKAEWGGQFRDDVQGFVDREAVEAVTRPSPLVLPFDRQYRYTAFIDPAGGGKDEFCMAIGHEQDGTTVTDLLMARHGTPAAIVEEYAGVLREYMISEATADRYAGSWPSDEFARYKIRINAAEKPKSDLYKDALATLNSGRCELPPDDKLLAQLCGLERKTRRGGKDSIDHQVGGHDDRANVVAGLMANRKKPSTYDIKALS